MSRRLGPLAFAIGLGMGIGLALTLRAYVLGWGATLAFPATTLLVSLGAWRERDGEGLTSLLRFLVGFTAAYLAGAVPLTWFSVDEAVRASLAHEVWSRWAVIALSLPGGVTTLVARTQRERADAARDDRDGTD